MKYKFSYIILAAYLVFAGCVSSNKNNKSKDDELTATSLKPYGRYFTDAQQNLGLISSAVHFGFNFSGTTCTVYAFINDASGHNYLQYELDGVYQKRLKVEGEAVQQIVITANGSGKHTVEIYKATEATTGTIFIQKIKGNDIHTIQPSSAPQI